MGDKQLIGVDNIWGPLAIDSNCTKDDAGNKYYQIYSWSNGWDDIDPDNPEITTTLTPINPTYYSDNVSDYLICQDNNNNNNAIKCVISGSDKTPIGSDPGPSIPGSFTNSLLVYDGNTLTRYAY